MSDFTVYPLNDLTIELRPKTVDATTGLLVPLTTGTVTAFLATSSSPTATTADATLTTTGTYYTSGSKWVVTFDASVLTAALLASLFASATPYCIIQQAGAFRVALTGAYSATRAADVT